MQIRVLIIDDQEEIAVVLKEYLDAHGFKTQVALNGKEAIDKFRSNKYQLLLTDYKLPDMDGITVANVCKKFSPELKIIFITGYKSRLQKIKNKMSKDFQIIDKPCRPKIILNEINKIMNN